MAPWIWVLPAIALLYWVYAAGVLAIDSWHTPAVRTDAPLPESPPLVSVLLPARNEERNLPRCLASLGAQDYPRLEIVVIDDRSDDATGAIARDWAARDSRVRVVAGADLPEGWLGKNWANHQGVQGVAGEWLLFTDADTWHHPAAMRGCLALARQAELDAVTLGPFLECRSFWERVFQPTIYAWISVHIPAFRINRPGSGVAIANGQYILIRRAAYDAIGGHEAIRDRIADDMALAMNLKRQGRRFWMVGGLGVLRTRMYASLAEIWEGWGKNLMVGLGNRLATLAAVVALVALTSLLPFVILALGLVGLAPSALALALSAAACALLLAIQAIGMARFEVSPLYALLHPLAALLFLAILVNSAIRSRSGMGVVWKGRVIQRPR